MASLPRCDHPFFPQFHTSPRPHSTSADHRCSQFLGGINSTGIPNGGANGNKVSRLTFNLNQFQRGKSRPCAQQAQNLGAFSHNVEEKDAKLFSNCFLPRSDKIVVAVDIDEVLGNFLLALNRFIADRYSLNHSISEYHVYEYSKIWNCSLDEATTRVHEFFETSYFKQGIQPVPGAQQALHNLSRFCNLSVVTSRQVAIKDHTIEWIEKHYPGLFQGIHFGNHFALDGQSRSKSEICRSLGAKIIIDDNPKYAIDCAEAGIRVLLFDYENSYPWSKVESFYQHPLVSKVRNWDEVEEQIVSWIIS